MKRLMTIFAVMATILASCSKSEPESGNKDANESGNITLNLSVSEFGGGDSKAPIKTGWASGDQLLIWFDANAGEKPDMAIKYNGSGWEQDGSVPLSGNSPEASGSMKVLYNNTLCVTAKDPYTYNSGTSTLSGRIQTWTFLTEIQVVVSGLTPADYAKYTLSCSNFTPFTGYTVGTESITAQAGDAGTFVQGISNTDGVAFVFASCTKYGSSAQYKFSLNDGSSSSTSGSASISKLPAPECVEIEAKYNGSTLSKLKWAKWNVGASKPEEYGYYFFWGGTQGYIYSTAKRYTLTKNLAQNVSQIKGIKIASSSFNGYWVKAENGEELVGGFCWENTPHTNGTYSSSNKKVFTKYIPSGKTEYWAGSGSPDNKLQLDLADDAARAYCGEGYRMPTRTEFQALRDVTYWAWDVTDNGYYVFKPGQGTSGSAGGRGTIAGTDDKTKALLFFPLSGYGYNTSLNFAGYYGYGYNWSSSLYSSSPYYAIYLHFYSVKVIPQHQGNRCNGFPVRPVSD